ncbi:MAG: hypothetical protein NC122_05435 [Faecalibacterium sp.]|nr:hypothetical protein [Ruminococcus sp.]MCM1391896.1 hypothetical protein [Ruminococcus sp.]MCM1485630.1 hypothetical protein [Faecalibacterium sp.]
MSMDIIHIDNCTIEVDREKTAQYYKTVEKCTCTACQNFQKIIREKQPRLAAFLDSLGVDIAVPDENTWYTVDETQTVVYHPYYLISGKIIDGYRAYLPDLNINIVFEKEPFINTRLEAPCFALYFEEEIKLPWKMEEAFESDFSDVYIGEINTKKGDRIPALTVIKDRILEWIAKHFKKS